MLNRKWLLLSVVFVVAVALAVPSVYGAGRRYLSIASGWVTGAYYPFAGAVSRADFGIFFRQVQSVGQLRRCQHAHRLLGEGVHADHLAAGIGVAAKTIEARQ